jgi:hypothetical protein
VYILTSEFEDIFQVLRFLIPESSISREPGNQTFDLAQADARAVSFLAAALRAYFFYTHIHSVSYVGYLGKNLLSSRPSSRKDISQVPRFLISETSETSITWESLGTEPSIVLMHHVLLGCGAARILLPLLYTCSSFLPYRTFLLSHPS